MYQKVQREQAVKYYSDGHWLFHELANGPIPVPPSMGRILLCLPSHPPPCNADHHLKVVEDIENIALRHSVLKTPSRQRIATAPKTPSTPIKNMRIQDYDDMVPADTLFEMERTDDGESFWINTAPSPICAALSPKKLESTYPEVPGWIRRPLSPNLYTKWPEMMEDMDKFMIPLQNYLVAADALRKAQEMHGDWVTPSKFYDIWWKYRVCCRKGLIGRYYGETFKTAAKEVTLDDINHEKLRLVCKLARCIIACFS